MKKTPKVNEVNEFLEIASDFEDPLEVIRESLSNAYDAQATEVEITIRSQPSGSDIIIEDDGYGMDDRDLESFFDLGNSTKTDSIGYKGHGTKIFYKSNRIVVNTAQNGVNRRAVMDRPWEKLNEKTLPEYNVTTSETRAKNTGTRIKIEGFKSGKGFDPESLTYNKIHHYLKWKTIAGSTEYLFHPETFRKMDVRVVLDDDIDDSQNVLETTNRFEFPEEQLTPEDSRFPTERMCKVYPPREIEFDHEEGTSVIQIVGMIGGKAARNELPTYGKHSAQFGVWLAKDHIKVERLNEAISHDNEFLHFFFVANCQDIELSANREKIRNKSSSMFQNLKEELSHYLSKIGADPWFKEYLEQRRVAELNRRAKSQESTLEERLEQIQARSGFEPSNKTEVVLALERSNTEESVPLLTVEDFDPASDITALLRNNGDIYSAAIHQQLTDYFDENTPIENIDKIICWEYGDRDKLKQIERTGYHDSQIEIDLNEQKIEYGADYEKSVEIVNVKERLLA